MTFKKKVLVALLSVSALTLNACSSSGSSDNGNGNGNGNGDTVSISTPASFETGVTLTVGDTTVNTTGAFAAADIETNNTLNSSAWTSGWTVNIHGNSTVWSKPTDAVANNDCPTGTTLVGEVHELDACQLPAIIEENVTLTNDNVYLLNNGGTKVGNGNEEVEADRTITGKTLTIEAGTLILGSEASYLLITRDNQIDAEGTASSPIVMRSTNWAETGTEDRGTWGGVVIQGNGKDFKGTNVEGEGGVEFYAGSDDADNSGTFKYVVITGAGYDLDGNGTS